MTITRADLQALARRRDQPSSEPGEVFACFIGRPLTNPMNAKGYGGHWTKHMRWARNARDAAWGALLETWGRKDYGARPAPHAPKAIRFIAYVGREWDDDNLRSALKPTRDALTEAGVINDDRPSAGHLFCYEQVIDRTRAGKRGVEIRVKLRDDEDGALNG